jgi:hypothetical protein
VFTFSFLLGASSARAMGPCGKDTVKYCKGVRPGQGRIIRCLYHNRDRLSPACKEKARRDWEKLVEVNADCASDVRKHCAKVIPGGGRIIACLLKHEDQLQPKCKKHAVKTRKGVENFFLGPCKKDREKFCPDVKAGGGRIVKCLSGHMSELKPRCRKRIKGHKAK